MSKARAILDRIEESQGDKNLEAALKSINWAKFKTLYHVTPADRVDSILEKGLLISQERATTGGEIRGIYLGSDSDVRELMMGTPIRNPVVLKVDVSSFYKDLKLDPEYHADDEHFLNGIVDGKTLGQRLDNHENGLYVYYTKNIDPKFIKRL